MGHYFLNLAHLFLAEKWIGLTSLAHFGDPNHLATTSPPWCRQLCPLRHRSCSLLFQLHTPIFPLPLCPGFYFCYVMFFWILLVLKLSINQAQSVLVFFFSFWVKLGWQLLCIKIKIIFKLPYEKSNVALHHPRHHITEAN